MPDANKKEEIGRLVGGYAAGVSSISRSARATDIVDKLTETGHADQVGRALIGRCAAQLLRGHVYSGQAITTAIEWARQTGIPETEIPAAIVDKFGPLLNTIQKDQPDLFNYSGSVEARNLTDRSFLAIGQLERHGIVWDQSAGEFQVAAKSQ